VREPESLEGGPKRPNPKPHTDLTLAMVLWNEAPRLPALIKMAHRWFGHVVMVVQDSSDDTLEIARKAERPGDRVIADAWHGTGDASMPKLLKHVDTDWVFVLAGDEMPSKELLETLWTAGWWGEENGVDGLWIPFHSTIDGIAYTEQHGHLRMFKTELGWPHTMHSRPTVNEEAWWPFGYVDHDRSLSELVVDYLRYLSMSDGNSGWIAHNRLMLRSACEGVAEVKGWDYVHSHEWWPQVEAAVFTEE